MKKLSFFAALPVLLLTGCTPSLHPGALSQFDSASYDSFVYAHGALGSLRAQVLSEYPKYAPQFNQAAASYNTAYNSYVLFRSAPTQNQQQVAVEMSNLTVSIVALEDAIQRDLHVPPAAQAAIRAKALKIRKKAEAKFGNNAQSNISLADILTELEIAASIAQAVPVAAPYAALAEIVIQATQAALAAGSSVSGQPINLATIAPVALIS